MRYLFFNQGLSAALTRQITYTTLRLGLYTSLREKWASEHNGLVSTSAKFGIGMLSGATASAISTPVEVCMVRMYNDGASSAVKGATPRGYRNIVDALYRIGRDEGVRGLWAGAGPTIVRSMVVNCVQLGTYDAAKEQILASSITNGKDSVGVHLIASTVSGFCYSVATLPIDSAKTRMQNQRRNKDGSLPYRNLMQAIVKVGSEEGVRSLFRGCVLHFFVFPFFHCPTGFLHVLFMTNTTHLCCPVSSHIFQDVPGTPSQCSLYLSK